MKKLHKQDANYHLGDMNMNFLTAVVSGMDKHLITPTGAVKFNRLADAKKNEKFRNHVLDEFSKGAEKSLGNIEHDAVLEMAQTFQKKYVAAASRVLKKVENKSEDFNHIELVSQAEDAFEKVHAQLLSKL